MAGAAVWELQYVIDAKAELQLIEEHEVRIGIEKAFKNRLVKLDDPRRDNFVKPLRLSKAGYFRLHFGNFRAIFRLLVDGQQLRKNTVIDGDKHVLQVVCIGDRSKIYSIKRSEYRRRENGFLVTTY